MATKSPSTLVLSDFDGTLTQTDTFKAFIRFFFSRQSPRLSALKAIGPFVLWKANLLGADVAKEKIWKALFGGLPEALLVETGKRFCAEQLPALLRPGALECMQAYLQSGSVVCIVTASASYWTAPWCEAQGFEWIATQYAVQEGILSGTYAGLNCRGKEKVHRIRQRYPLDHFKTIIALGDTPDDQPMLSIATQAYYKPFEPGTDAANKPPC